MKEEAKNNDLQEIITQALNDLKIEQGDKFDITKVNLAELGRMTGLTRAKLRKIQKDQFVIRPHGLIGHTSNNNVVIGYSGVIDDLLRKGVKNSVTIFDRIQELGYSGSKSALKNYIQQHKSLLPPKRLIISPQGNRGRR